MSQITIKHGDNINLLKELADNSIDSVVTDAPYGLGKEPDPTKMIESWLIDGYMAVKGKGFMGKSWDSFVPQPVFWKEVFRVLKPGGHVVCFFGTRTYDWGTLAIRLAGFEIRDMITWHYGSGFPKSLDVSKAIDKHFGADREIIGNAIDVNGRIRAEENNGGLSSGYAGGLDKSRVITAASTESAKEWEGYGTALKPATEPICIARKPLIGSVAQNILEYGTGGINIDGCRIDVEENDPGHRPNWEQHSTVKKDATVYGKYAERVTKRLADGRFPANVILDEYTASLMDEQTGVLTSGKPSGQRNASNNIYGQYGTGQDVTGFGDSGGASRFFYCAKASQEERHAGLRHHATRKTDDGRTVVSDNAFQRSNNEHQNFHPTVKPISLMRWLIRLVTPKGGTCVDTFAGSGTTGCAAAFEDVDIILMEAESDYIPIIESRTAYWQKQANREKYIQQLKDSVQTLF